MSRWPLILPYDGVTPSFATPLRHAGERSTVLGRASLGAHGSLGARAVIRADGHVVTIGDDFHLGPRSTVHIAHGVFACIIGDRVHVGENACVHACTVGNDVIIGDNVVILDGAVVEDHVVFEAGATVFPGKKIASGHVYAGSPAAAVGAVTPEEVSRRRAALRARSPGEAPLAPVSRPAPGSAIDASTFVPSTASIRGRLNAAPNSSVWFSNDFDAGDAAITLGVNTNVQDNTIIRCSTAQGVTLGRDTTVGHNVFLNDCVVGDRSLIGIGSTVAVGTIVGDGVLLAAGARTEPGQVLESGWLYGRTPARKIAPLDAKKHELIAFIIGTYCEYAQSYAASERALLSGTRR